MASEAQIAANQANARRSTGPVTPEGKARSARNALKHGLTARHLVIQPDEQAEFDELQAALLDEIDPRGALETLTFRELLHAAWNLQRLRRIESEFCALGPEEYANSGGEAAYDRLSRYQSRAQRAYYRALAELRALQTNRALREQNSADAAGTAPAPPLAHIGKLPKRTQLAPPRPRPLREPQPRHPRRAA